MQVRCPNCIRRFHFTLIPFRLANFDSPISSSSTLQDTFSSFYFPFLFSLLIHHSLRQGLWFSLLHLKPSTRLRTVFFRNSISASEFSVSFFNFFFPTPCVQCLITQPERASFIFDILKPVMEFLDRYVLVGWNLVKYVRSIFHLARWVFFSWCHS